MRRVLVTGGARGIGREIVSHLADCGYAVAVLDLTLNAHEEFPEDGHCNSVIDQLTDQGVDALGFEADITDPAALQVVCEEIGSKWGALDGIVCNAGGGIGPLDGNHAGSIDLGDLDTVLSRNLYGTINTVQAALPLLRAAGACAIVTMSSQNGLDPTADGRYAHYGIAKAAVAHYTRYLAQDLGREGIRVNCVAPGPIMTGRIRQRMAESAQVHEGFTNALQRFGNPDDVSSTVKFLLGDESKFITGQVLRIDGGLV